MTSTLSLTTTPNTATTAPAEMDDRLVNLIDLVGSLVLQVPASLTSSVALPVGTRHAHRLPRTPDQMSPLGSATDASGTWSGIQS
ncbi:hypothetical protein DVH24_002394 [Malus domestica]|uniref:Uncharacterized protein n=1 Tax=Malus domestica TaxID=3750 RepID=A0A498IKW5_MALDO|nr:hypothetical protein DVH24_002394 [Malus domestica]